MVWLSNSHTNQIEVETLFHDYKNYNIRFGIINIDSRWATGFNTFVFNSHNFSDPKQLLDEIRADNVKIVLWMTSFVDVDSPNYEYAQTHGYLFNKTIKWWHGEGRLLNYFNPEAVDWWHQQISNLTKAVGPIHAFKADGSDPYIIELLDPNITWLKYRTAYYNDTFQILRQLVGDDALIMSRPVDADLDFSPRDVVFMGWVGDEDGTYKGLQTALRYMLESGRRGYVGFGSDIGGYRADPNATLGRTKELFLRWTAIGALSSFMENGGNGEHRPWIFDNETVEIYRSWVNLHYSIVPYLYTFGTKAAMSGKGTLMMPCDDIETFLKYTYFLGPSFYVAPVFKDPKPNDTERVWLPKSSKGGWMNIFDLKTYSGSHFIDQDVSRLDQIPLYVENGQIIPMYD
ncbi:unnamed protein product, partial [Didymodactylos carnosus]